MERLDIAVVGNGIIGTLAAVELEKAGLKVALIGPAAHQGSASLAAGAMLNVYGEIDGPLDDYGKRKLEIGLKAIGMWKAMLPADIFTANDTRIYLKDGASLLERRAFDAISRAINTPVSCGKEKLCYLPDEPAVHTPKLFDWLESQFKGIHLSSLDQIPAHLMPTKGVYCAGAYTGDIIPGLLPLFYGVGTSMLISDIELNIPPSTVMRSPNRGNTCGLHIVPREPGVWYVGAGSYISTKPTDGYRIETLRYLTKCLEDDFGADVWQASIKPLKGYRPMSFDGKPMLGTLKTNANVYVATGTKRDGLTIAPMIVEDIVAWATGSKRDGRFDGWEPDRKPISYGTQVQAQAAYVANRVAAMKAHGHKMDEANAAREYCAAHEKYRIPMCEGLHPEIVGVLL